MVHNQVLFDKIVIKIDSGVTEMIHGIGIDMIELHRVKAIQQKNPKFANKVLTVNEYKIFETLSEKRQVEFLAGRFSVKEAYSKALGTGIGSRVSFEDLEILNQPNGAPYFAKYPQQDTLFAHVSLSHTANAAISEVILEKK